MARSNRSISNIAYNLLKKYGFTSPAIDVRELAENKLGMKIKYERFGDSISGVLAVKNGVPTIGVNSDQGKYRQRFTIAHEIGHYVLKHDRNGLFVDHYKKHFSGKLLFRNEETSTGEINQEREANAFAAALLMPEPMIRKEIEKMSETAGAFDLSFEEEEGEGKNFISQLAAKFEVSQQAMSFRFLNLRIH